MWTVIAALSEKASSVTGTRLSKNIGQHPAITAGIHSCHANWYVVMDGDLQDVPEAIEDLYRAAVERNADSVIAKRHDEDVKRGKKLGSMIFNSFFERLADLPASSQIGNFRIFNNEMAETFRAYPEKCAFSRQ